MVTVVILTALLAVSTTVVLTVKAEDLPITGGPTGARVFRNPTHLGPIVNSSANECDPHISADGLLLYFLSRRPGGLGEADIWVTARQTEDGPWGTPVNLGAPINTPAFEGAPCTSADGLELYFASDRSGGSRDLDIWVAKRNTKDGPWGAPVSLGPRVNTSGVAENGPSISGDGLELYFSEAIWSNARPGGFGGADIWVTMRKTKEDPWETPINLGSTVNSSDNELAPSISSNGLWLYFHSNRRPSSGDMDVWVSTRKSKDEPWPPPVNLGPTVNSSSGEWNPDISSDGATLYFGSGRRDSQGMGDIWQVSLKKNGTKE